MRVPVIRGTIDRRILVNYRIDPEVLGRILPDPFTPKKIHGFGVGGICLIRLKNIRPNFIPIDLGVGSENAAHRFAVQWKRGGTLHEGVYVPRRDTSSRLNTLLGGRMFPGQHQHARFDVEEKEGRFSVRLQSDDGSTRLAVEGVVAEELPSGSIFRSLQEASGFFEAGSLGYSPNHRRELLEGVELRVKTWDVHPLAVSRVESSYFSDETVFPPGAAAFDHALLMTGIEHEWHGRDSLYV